MSRVAAILLFFGLGTALAEPPEEKPTKAPPATEAEIRDAMERGVEFLLARQNPSGSWGSARNTKGLNIFAPIPGSHRAFRCAVTAMSIEALIRASDWERNEETRKALVLAEDYLLEYLPQLRRATPVALYNVWAHGYGVQALVAMHERPRVSKKRKARIREVIESQFDMLTRFESVDGGWGYYDFRYGTKQPSSSSISFVSGAILCAFYDAKVAGIDPPERLVTRAIASINRQRNPNNSYFYGEYLKDRPVRDINRASGSLGRSQCCNIALRFWGDESVDDEILIEWLDRLEARNFWLDIGRKRPIPHESWAAIAGYFFYFGHYYAGRCVAELPPEKATEYGARLAALILDDQEKDGSWWDFPFYDYHQQYGTAYALLTLVNCLPVDE
ncbi:MAG: prenyltransferase/squalene oxidase repeat-containing protein [Verrucomicrobiota bacterium]